MCELAGGEHADQQHAEHAFGVQVAPHRDNRDRPPERRRGAEPARALDEQRARGDAGKRRDVRPRNRARLDDEESDHQDRDRGRNGRPLTAREVDQHEHQREQRAVEELNPDAVGGLPGKVAGQVVEPGRVRLRIVRVVEVEDVAADEPSGGRLAALRQVPPEIGLVNAPEGQDDGGRYRKREEQRRPEPELRQSRDPHEPWRILSGQANPPLVPLHQRAELLHGFGCGNLETSPTIGK